MYSIIIFELCVLENFSEKCCNCETVGKVSKLCTKNQEDETRLFLCHTSLMLMAAF